MTDIVEVLRDYAQAEDLSSLERENLRAAADEIERLRAEPDTLKAQEPVDWQYRFFHTVASGWSKWEKVLPRNPYTDTQLDRVTEIQTYIDQGYMYELRPLYAAPLPSVPDDEKWFKHAARMAELSQQLRGHESDRRKPIRDMRRELAALEDMALTAAPKPREPNV